MPRKVRTILAKMGLPDGPVSSTKAGRMAERYVSENLKAQKFSTSTALSEDQLVEMIDDKHVFGILMEEYLPILKRIRKMRNTDEQLQALAKLAPLVLGRSLMFGDPSESRQAAKEVLDRVQGKAIERQMTMQVNVNAMTETEVDHELTRLLSKFNPSSEQPSDRAEAIIVKPHEEERRDLGRDEGRSGNPEPSAETVSDVEGEDKGVYRSE